MRVWDVDSVRCVVCEACEGVRCVRDGMYEGVRV